LLRNTDQHDALGCERSEENSVLTRPYA